MNKPFKFFIYFILLNIVALIVLFWVTLIFSINSFNNRSRDVEPLPKIEMNTIVK